MGSPPLDLEAFRQARLVAVSVPCGLVALGVGSAAVLRSAFAGRDVEQEGAWRARLEVCHVFLYPFVSSLPLLSVLLKKTQYTKLACITSHVVRSLALFSAGMGWLPTAESMRVILQANGELVLDCVLALQDKLPRHYLAVLYILRQIGWGAIATQQLGVSAADVILRGMFNWCFMMGMSSFLEWRLRIAWQRASAIPQRSTSGPPSLHLPPASLCASEFSSALPSPTKGAADSPTDSSAGAGGCPAAFVRDEDGSVADAEIHDTREYPTGHAFSWADESAHNSGSQALAISPRVAAQQTRLATVAGLPMATAATPVAATASDVPVATELALPARPVQLSEVPAATADAEAALRPPYVLVRTLDVHAAPAAAAEAVAAEATLSQQATRASSARQPSAPEVTGALQAGQAQPSAQLISAAQARAVAAASLVRAAQAGYRPSAERRTRRVYVKLPEADLRDMPLDLKGQLGGILDGGMPGLTVAGLAVRSGCVMLAIDLQALGHDISNDTVLIETLSQAVAQMTAHVNMNNMTLQIEDTLYTFKRTSPSVPFHLSLSSSPAPVSADTSALALRSVAPVVHCVGSTQLLTAQVKLELPRGCHLLEQWKPPGLPHGSDAGSAHVGGQAKLLVREARGDNLPVRAEVVCVEATDAMTTLHTVQVHVDLPPASALCPMGLSLELWYTPATAGMSTGPAEFLAAHVPMLAFPHVCQDAASELAQIVPQLAGVPVLQHVGAAAHMRPITDSAQNVHASMIDTAQEWCGMWDEGTDGTAVVEHILMLRGAGSASSIAMQDTAGGAPQQLDDSSNMAELVEDMGVFFSVYGPAWGAKQHRTGTSCATNSSDFDADISQALLAYLEGIGMEHTARLLRGMLQCAQNEQEQEPGVAPAHCADSNTPAASPSRSPAPLPTTPPAFTTPPDTPWPVLSWLAHVRDMLATTADPDYQTWSMKQSRTLIHRVCAMILAMAAMLLYRCLADKAPTAKTFFTVSQTLPYVYLAFKSRKNGSLSYQMLKVTVMMATFGNALAFWYMGTMVDKISQVWLSANRNHSDSIFFVCIVPAIDPTPVRFLLLTKVVFAWCHGQALRKARCALPGIRAMLTYIAAIGATVAYQLRQVHLYRQEHTEAAQRQRRKLKEA